MAPWIIKAARPPTTSTSWLLRVSAASCPASRFRLPTVTSVSSPSTTTLTTASSSGTALGAGFSSLDPSSSPRSSSSASSPSSGSASESSPSSPSVSSVEESSSPSSISSSSSSSSWGGTRSEEHTSELQSLLRNSYAVFCLQKKHITHKNTSTRHVQIRVPNTSY